MRTGLKISLALGLAAGALLALTSSNRLSKKTRQYVSDKASNLKSKDKGNGIEEGEKEIDYYV